MLRFAIALCVAFPALVHAQPADPPPDPSPPADPPPVEPEAPQPTPEPPPPPDPIAACKALDHDIATRAAKIADINDRGRVLATMVDCSHIDAHGVAIASAGAASVANSVVVESRYHETGYAFGVELELASTALTGGAVTLPSTHAFIGSQGANVTFGLALDFEHDSVSEPMSAAQTFTTVLLGPSVGVTIARSATGRSELVGVASVAYRFYDSSTGAGLDHRLAARLGPSFRYWLSPNFAASVTTDVRLDQLASNGGDSVTVVSLGSALDLMGVF
jgi:hypothetical protein